MTVVTDVEYVQAAQGCRRVALSLSFVFVMMMEVRDIEYLCSFVGIAMLLV